MDKVFPSGKSLTQELVNRHLELWGELPEQAVFDGGFCSRANFETLKSSGVRDVVFTRALRIKVSEMAKSNWCYRTLWRFRAGIEGVIGYLILAYGLRAAPGEV